MLVKITLIKIVLYSFDLDKPQNIICSKGFEKNAILPFKLSELIFDELK